MAASISWQYGSEKIISWIKKQGINFIHIYQGRIKQSTCMFMWMHDLPCSICVHARQRQEASRQAMEGKDAKSIWKGIKRISMISKASKEATKQTSKKANKRWCPQGKNVGLDWMSIASLCWSMDDTLASKTHAWTWRQACKDAFKGNEWHKQAW